MQLNLIRFGITAMVLLGLSSLWGHGQGIVPQFQDETQQPGFQTADIQFSGFNHESDPTYPTISGSQTWPSPIAASNGNSTATLNKPDTTQTSDFLTAASGGTGGIYAFFSNTQYVITQTAPLANLSSLTFQLYEGAGSDGNSYNGIYLMSAMPTLTLTLADSSKVTFTGTAIGDVNGIAGLLSQSAPTTIFGMSTTLDDVGFSFDVTGVTQPITSYSLTMTVPTHSIAFGFDVTEAQAVPEPSTWAIMLMGFTALLFHFSWRRGRSALM